MKKITILFLTLVYILLGCFNPMPESTQNVSFDSGQLIKYSREGQIQNEQRVGVWIFSSMGAVDSVVRYSSKGAILDTKYYFDGCVISIKSGNDSVASIVNKLKYAQKNWLQYETAPSKITGEQIFKKNCISCHNNDLNVNPINKNQLGYIIDVIQKYTEKSVNIDTISDTKFLKDKHKIFGFFSIVDIESLKLYIENTK